MHGVRIVQAVSCAVSRAPCKPAHSVPKPGSRTEGKGMVTCARKQLRCSFLVSVDRTVACCGGAAANNARRSLDRVMPVPSACAACHQARLTVRHQQLPHRLFAACVAANHLIERYHSPHMPSTCTCSQHGSGTPKLHTETGAA